jgi:hypothetical protein
MYNCSSSVKALTPNNQQEQHYSRLPTTQSQNIATTHSGQQLSISITTVDSKIQMA